MRREIRLSALSSLRFAVLFGVLIILWQAGYTKIYLRWSDYPLWYHPLSLLAALLLHETYYYWLHRWMHRPKVYRLLHQWHHESIHSSSLTAFSFHPLEATLQAIVIPLMMLFCVLLAVPFDHARWRSGSIWAPCILHGIINGSAGGFGLFAWGGHPLVGSPVGLAGFITLALLTIGILVFDGGYRATFTGIPPAAPRAGGAITN